MWPRIVSTAVGIWLMAAPAALGYTGLAATNDRIVGPLAATFSIVAMWEITRALRRLNLLLGAWLLLAPLVLGYASHLAGASSVVSGAVLIAMSFLGGEITQRVGGGWRVLWKE